MAETLRQIIAERTVIRKERRLTMPGEVFVREGEPVQPDTLIARTGLVPGAPCVVNIARDLKITPSEAAAAMLVKVGDRVEHQQVLARINKGFFHGIIEVKSPVTGLVEFISETHGRILIREEQREASPPFIVQVARLLDVSPARLRWYVFLREGREVKAGQVLAADYSSFASLPAVYSPVSGTIEKICTHTGQVYIRRPYRPVVCDAYLAGTVERVIPEFGAIITTTGAYIQGIFGIGFETFGTLRAAVDTPDGILDEDGIRDEDRGAVLVAGSLVTLRALRRALDCGVRGIIAGGANHGDLSELIGREIGVGITGHEDVALTVVLTEGFGRLTMRERTFAILKAASGRQVCLNGSTQIRAGVIRPEVIIPDAAAGEPAAAAEPAAAQPLAVGASVRILRAPYFGQRGTVAALPEQEAQLESETRAHVALVDLPGGERVTVALENIEVE
ncbi:MAG: hypothetical protein ACM3XN_05430 [Chloroflexota bacterium]